MGINGSFALGLVFVLFNTQPPRSTQTLVTIRFHLRKKGASPDKLWRNMYLTADSHMTKRLVLDLRRKPRTSPPRSLVLSSDGFPFHLKNGLFAELYAAKGKFTIPEITRFSLAWGNNQRHLDGFWYNEYWTRSVTRCQETGNMLC